MLDWLKKEAVGKHVYFLIICSALINLIEALLVNVVIYTLHNLNIITITERPSNQDIEILSWYFLPFLIFAAFKEEIVFRLPLFFAIEREVSFQKMIFFTIILSVIFGLFHGSIVNIFMQGFCGFVFCILFLKCGGYQKKYIKAITVTTMAHFTYNLIIVTLTLLSGSHTF